MTSLLPLALTLLALQASAVPSPRARELANLCVEVYGAAAVDSLARLVSFETYARPDQPVAEHAAFDEMNAWLAEFCATAGLDFEDHGAVVVVGLGQAAQRVGIITHGDVQPADPTKWRKSPFVLDTESEPGRLVARGAEDDKGPIACALWAMRVIAEKRLPLARRIELIISYSEESDWAPFQEFLQANPPPDLNVALDAEYPVVVAEKGWCSIRVGFPDTAIDAGGAPVLESFTGGFFLSQVPENAVAVMRDVTPELEADLRAALSADDEVDYDLERDGDRLTIRSRGTSAHSSTPEQGRNGITHLAEVLAVHDWPRNAPAWAVRFCHDRLGTGFLAERFGDVAYADDFMGPLTLSLGTLKPEDGRLTAAINLRRPVGRSVDEVKASVEAAVESWKRESGCADVTLSTWIGEPYPPQEAAHVPVLLATFRHYTGLQDAQPISIGGGTHARLVPGGVNFGPAMPGEPYTGHSEHEFITREQFLLNLRMYTSLLIDLAAE